MLGKLFDKMLHEDEELVTKEIINQDASPKKFKVPWAWVIGIFLIAFLVRVGVLFFLTIPENVGPGWYGDAYHHWQIAYLTKEVGLSHGFLRLWDFKGLEYYWGLLHPLVLILGFVLSGSTSIVVSRMVSVIFGSGVIALTFLILHKYFDRKTALLGSAFLTFMPVVAFSDTVGMQEPLGLFFILLGIFLWPESPLISGASFMIAGMERSEYWIFSAILVLAIIFRSKANGHHKAMLAISYFVLTLLYMKYLLDYTGNPIYPIWIAYFATYKGDWFLDVTLTSLQMSVKFISQIIFGFSALGILFTLWRRPRYFLFIILGFLNIALISAMHGFGAYIKGFELKVLVDRLLAFPYGFVGVLVTILFVYFIPKILPKRIELVGVVFGAITVVLVLALTQITWRPILSYYKAATGNFDSEVKLAHAIAKNYTGKGKIFIPADRMVVTYALVNYEKISGKNLISQLYDPFYYYKGDDPFADWGEFRKEIIIWLEKNDAELYVRAKPVLVNEDFSNQDKMLKLEEGKLFELIDEANGFGIYRIKLDG